VAQFFWPGYREHDGFFLSEEQLASMSEDRSMNREPLYTRLLPCHVYLIHDERYMNEPRSSR